MIIDCDECVMQHTAACEDCVVSVLLHRAGDPIIVNDDEQMALGHLAEGGLVAPLRLVPRSDRDGTAAAG